MPQSVRDTGAMIAGMTPRLKDGAFVFCTTTSPAVIEAAARQALCFFREEEGVTVVLPVDVAATLGFDIALAIKHIELEVFSALDGVGLTAAVASALAMVGIPCNMVAAYHHDHVFVPAGMAERAVTVLEAAQRQAAG